MYKSINSEKCGTVSTYHILSSLVGKHCEKRRKCWLPTFSPFLTMFSTLLEPDHIITDTFKLLSANASIWTSRNFHQSVQELTTRYFYFCYNIFKIIDTGVQKISEFLLVHLPLCTCPTVRQRGIIHL